MKYIFIAVLILFIFRFSYAQENYQKVGLASYYSEKFQGRKTASGEKYDMNGYTAAHRTLPFNTYVRVTNINNGKSVIVRVNDRGPSKPSRIIDLSKAAAKEIKLIECGIAKVKVELYNSQSNMFVEGDCCYSQIAPLNQIIGFDYKGKRQGAEINSPNESFICIFSEDYIGASVSKVRVSPVMVYIKDKRRRSRSVK